MDPITIAMGLASLAPTVARWLGGEKAGEVAQRVVGVAQSLTGKADPQDAVSAILADQNARAQFIDAWKDIELGLYEAETRRLEEVNRTIRAEVASSDPFVRRARSSFLWAMSFAWTVEGLVVGGSIIWLTFARPEYGAEVLGGLKELMSVMSEHWLYAMAVSGVAVWSRSVDKKTAMQEPGLLERLAGAFRGR
jgi:hypothetical protein